MPSGPGDDEELQVARGLFGSWAPKDVFLWSIIVPEGTHAIADVQLCLTDAELSDIFAHYSSDRHNSETLPLKASELKGKRCCGRDRTLRTLREVLVKYFRESGLPQSVS